MSNQETELIPHFVKNLQGRMANAEGAEKKALIDNCTELLVVLHQSVDEFSDQEKVKNNLKSFVTSVNDFDISKLSGPKINAGGANQIYEFGENKIARHEMSTQSLNVNQYSKLPQVNMMPA